MVSKKIGAATPLNTPELLELVSEDVRDRVARGELEVVPGKLGHKPVIRDAKSKALVPNVGSGQYPGATDLGMVAKATAHKKSRPYRDAIEVLTPLGEGPEVPGSLAWWHQKAMWAATGAEQHVPCQHVGCDKKHLVAFKPDGALIFKFMEMIIGRAPATMDMSIDGTIETLLATLQKREVEVKVVTADPDEAAKRARMIEARFDGAGDSDEVGDAVHDEVIDAMFEPDTPEDKDS